MEHLEKELKLIRTTSQSKANAEATMEQQLETLRREVNNLKVNKLDTNECKCWRYTVVSMREFMKEDSATLHAVKQRIDDVKTELVAMQEQPSVDYEPKMNQLSEGLRKEIASISTWSFMQTRSSI